MYLTNTEPLTRLGCSLNAVLLPQDAKAPSLLLLQIFNLSRISIEMLENVWGGLPLPFHKISHWVRKNSLFDFLPSADYKVVCRRPWNHFLHPTHPSRLYWNRLLTSLIWPICWLLIDTCLPCVAHVSHCHTALSNCHAATLSNCHAVTPKSQFL
jgi:hypothetical protein